MYLKLGSKAKKELQIQAKYILALKRCRNLAICGAGHRGSVLFLHPTTGAWAHGGTAGQHHVDVLVLENVHITFYDGVDGDLIDATALHIQEGWLKDWNRNAY